MLAAIFLVLAVVDAALRANVAFTNTSASSVSVFDQSITGYTQGELLLLAAGLGLLLALLLGLPGAPPAHGVPSVASCGWRAAVEGRVAELERENARLRKEREGVRRTGTLVGPQGASSQAPQRVSHPRRRAGEGRSPAGPDGRAGNPCQERVGRRAVGRQPR